MKRSTYHKLGSATICVAMAVLSVGTSRADPVHHERKSGSPVAGFSVFLDIYYEFLSHGKIPTSVTEELAALAGLTEEETGYRSVLDIYENLGVADLTSYLNVRETPEPGGKIIGKMTKNSGCEILGEEDGWYYIKSGAVEGYVSAEYIATGEQAKELARNAAILMVRVETEALRIRTEPSTEAVIWDSGYRGESFEVDEDLGNGWVKVRMDGDDADSGGTTGYVYAPENATLLYTLSEAVAFTSNEEKGEQVASGRQSLVDYGMQFLGNPYVWGGTNPNTGADCSGFVQYLMKHGAGISMNRTSRDQGRQGREITKDEMRPGDLIFYGNNKGSINHVSMYIGNGQVIHSASKKTGVKISQWNYRTPVTIRNVMND